MMSKKTRLNCNFCGRIIWRVIDLLKSKKYYCGEKHYPPSGGVRRKISLSKLNELNPQWKNSLNRTSLHIWIKYRLPKTEFCQDCKKVPPYDLANISSTYNKKTYNRNLKNWEWLCRKCHMLKDGRLKKFPKTKIINFSGKKLNIREWSKELGLNRNTIPKRLKKGWPIKKALSTSGRNLN